MKLFKNRTLRSIKEEIEVKIEKLYQLTSGINHKELEKTVKDLRDRITEPFMFVIVGEVKAGKSSFINALLDTGKDICKVAPSPMTDTIQQIMYGEEEKEISVNEHIKQIYHPVEILKHIAIVDTPGTNTIIAHHQEITEGFIPASDLIVFVFESKNPYRQSAWEFFDYIQDEWRKKIIFVLQQKDLMEPNDLIINTEGVRKHAIEKGITDPTVFAVSAKQEMNGKIDESGFNELRSYIEENITSGQAPFLKLKNNINTGLTINDKIFKSLIIRKGQYEADVSFRDDIKETLESQKQKSQKQVDILIENVIAEYNRVTSQKETEINNGLSFFPMIKKSFKSLFSKQQGPKEWLTDLAKELEEDLNIGLKGKLNDGVIDISESIQQMGNIVDLKIRNSETILKNDVEIFSDIAEKRRNVLSELKEAFSNFLQKSENFYDESLAAESQNMAPNLAAGGGIAVVGVILATVTNTMVFDVTGGILTTIGLLFAGVTVGLKKRKIINGFRGEVDKGRTTIQTEVKSKLKNYIKNIADKIDANFHKFDDHIASEGEKITTLESEITTIEKDLKALDTKVDQYI